MTSKIKIGIVASQFGNVSRGGAEVQMEKTMHYLNLLDNVEAELITYHTNNLKQYDIVHIFKSNPEFTYIINTLKEQQIPYVVSSVYFPLHYWYEVFLYKWLPVFLPRSVRDWMFRTSIFSLWQNAKMLFPNTDEEAKFLVRCGVTTPIKIIPNGLDREEMKLADADAFFEKFPQLKGQKFVLNVGRIDRRKNQKRIVEACRELDIPVVIIGAVWEDDFYQEILSLNYDKAYFLGPVFDKKILYGAMASCEVFCLPSTLETPGIVALEAAYFNKPIVITKAGGTRYYFGDKAKYVNWKSTSEIKNAIAYYYNNPQNAPERIDEQIENCFWDNIAQQYNKLYSDILRSKK